MLMRLSCLALAAALLAGCGDDGGTDPDPPPLTVSVTTGTEPPPRFIPSVAVVAAGGEVTFTNASPVIHDVMSLNAAWTQTELDPGESFTVTLATPGTYNYQCNFHDGMTGTIRVE